jgi:hypothetical protein
MTGERLTDRIGPFCKIPTEGRHAAQGLLNLPTDQWLNRSQGHTLRQMDLDHNELRR